MCPEAYSWQPIEKCRPKLDANKYSRLDDTSASKLNVFFDKLSSAGFFHKMFGVGGIAFRDDFLSPSGTESEGGNHVGDGVSLGGT